MSTKDPLLFKDKQNIDNGQYNNFTLNKNHQISSDAFSRHSKTVTTDRRKRQKQNVRTAAPTKLSDFANNLQTKKESSHSWKKSTKDLSSDFVNNGSGKEDRLKKAKTINASTLSLYIKAYENSNEVYLCDVTKEDLKKNKLIKKELNAKQINFDSNAVIQNPFEFSRQQENGEAVTPEIAQFRASQQLLNPNLQSPQTHVQQPPLPRNPEGGIQQPRLQPVIPNQMHQTNSQQPLSRHSGGPSKLGNKIMAQSSTLDDFKSFINEFPAEAKFFGRASLPTEFTGKEADIRSSVSMEATTTTQLNYSPCSSERNSIDFKNFYITPPKSVHEFTYTVSSQSSSTPPPPPPPKPPRILYGPCPGRHSHSAEQCPICHLTDQEYRLERLEQSRHVYGKLSKEYAKKSSIQRSNSINSKKESPLPPLSFGSSTTTMINGRKFDRRSTIAYPPPTIHRQLTTTTAKMLQQQQQRRATLAMPSTTTISSSRKSIAPSTSTLMAPTMSSSRKSVTTNFAPPSRQSLAPASTLSRRPSLAVVLPSTSRLLAPTMSSTRKSLTPNMEARRSLASSMSSCSRI